MSICNLIAPVLESTALVDIASPKQQVCTIEHNVSIADVLRTLARRNILSAPLVAGFDLEDVAEASNNMDTAPSLLGWIDIADIVSALIKHLKSKHEQLPCKMLALMSVLEADGPAFTQKMAITLTSGQDRGLVYQVNNTNSLLHVIKDVFLKPSVDASMAAVHRVAVFNAHGEVVNVVSQTDIIRFLHNNMEALGPLADTSLQQLGLLAGRPPVVSVNPHIPALIAYQKMLEAGVSGAAVVADSGELIANLSLSELRAIQPEHFGALALPVGEFLALLHGTVYVGYSAMTSSAAKHPFFASAASTGNRNESDIKILTALPTTTFRQV